ncbi:MAG: carbon-nitrogen hydrolase family protein [Gordonia sp. (in: high G+C Gram-positive bacteria)]|uniref:carbon-nitrogen hydrolase family protein n=1 Tax=Gordonia sp. (in: high G+C Gram-positive bacteria) TaxID=84139 RepID=UPI0039E5B0B7
MRIAMAQITAGFEPSANLALVREEAAAVAADGADLVVFPEATMCRFGRSLREVAEPLDGPWATGVRDIAEQLGIAVIVGMFTPGAGDKIRNTVLVVDRDGRPSRYDKIHCYDAFGFAESDTVEPGAHALVVDLPIGSAASCRLGVATCYDLRFPELFGSLADAGAEVIAVPTSWGAGPGKVEQWRTLTAARALDAGAFVVAVDQAPPPDAGTHRAPTGVGRSRLVDPFGSVVDDEYGETPVTRVHEVDPGIAARARETLGMRANRRGFAPPGSSTPHD